MLQKLMKKKLRVPTREQSDLRTFLVPSPEGNSDPGFGVAIFFLF
ncbi:hypothetical protein E2C01_054623 [Portunus trituberculatus]|uniref:Uncharacterized protein n=1 Tax=Portunus trituberculatus TaxID=210409 RepID=A0A5B7GK42_PORTR|nr:hypothetical protein [Portunus trituberculatus]